MARTAPLTPEANEALRRRAKALISRFGTQLSLARVLGISGGTLSAFLAGKAGASEQLAREIGRIPAPTVEEEGALTDEDLAYEVADREELAHIMLGDYVRGRVTMETLLTSALGARAIYTRFNDRGYALRLNLHRAIKHGAADVAEREHEVRELRRHYHARRAEIQSSWLDVDGAQRFDDELLANQDGAWRADYDAYVALSEKLRKHVRWPSREPEDSERPGDPDKKS